MSTLIKRKGLISRFQIPRLDLKRVLAQKTHGTRKEHMFLRYTPNTHVSHN